MQLGCPTASWLGTPVKLGKIVGKIEMQPSASRARRHLGGCGAVGAICRQCPEHPTSANMNANYTAGKVIGKISAESKIIVMFFFGKHFPATSKKK